MDSGLISADMKTITLADVKAEPSMGLLEEKSRVYKPKPKLALPEAINIDAPIISALDKKGANIDVSEEHKKAIALNKEKIALEEIFAKLEDVRLNLTNSDGQGFLMNASSIISGYIRNTYRDEIS